MFQFKKYQLNETFPKFCSINITQSELTNAETCLKLIIFFFFDRVFHKLYWNAVLRQRPRSLVKKANAQKTAGWRKARKRASIQQQQQQLASNDLGWLLKAARNLNQNKNYEIFARWCVCGVRDRDSKSSMCGGIAVCCIVVWRRLKP